MNEWKQGTAEEAVAQPLIQTFIEGYRQGYAKRAAENPDRQGEVGGRSAKREATDGTLKEGVGN